MKVFALTLAAVFAAASSPFCTAEEVPAPEAWGAPASERPPLRATPSEDEIRAAIARLESEDFGDREQATIDVWAMGRAAEPLLREAVTHGGLELRYRAQEILAEFDLGLFLETAEDIRNLAKRIRKGDPTTRKAAIESLAEMGEFELLARLARRANLPGQSNLIAPILSKYAHTHTPQLILDGNLEKAAALLKLSATAGSGFRHYVAFLNQSGQLDSAIEAQRTIADKSSAETKMLAWMLRARGDLDEAEQLFAELEEFGLQQQTRVAAGDFRAFVREFSSKRKRAGEELAISLATARLADDQGAADKVIEEIAQHARNRPTDAGKCLDALILNGATGKAFELAEEVAKGEFAEMKLWRNDFDAAFAALGADGKVQPCDKWLDKFTEDFAKRGEKKITQAIAPADRLARACISTGQTEGAERVMRTVGRLLAAEDASRVNLLRLEVSLGLSTLAREHALEAFAGTNQGSSIIRSIYLKRAGYLKKADYSGLANGAWQFIRKEFPDEPLEATLLRMDSLFDFDHNGHAKHDPTALLASIKEAAAAEEDHLPRKRLLHLLAGLANLHERWQMAADAMAEKPPLGARGSALQYVNVGKTMMRAERFAEAAEAFGAAWEMSSEQPHPLYLKGVALIKAGEAEAGSTLKQQAKLIGLAHSAKQGYLIQEMAGIGEIEDAGRQAELLLRLLDPNDWAFAQALQSRYLNLELKGDSAAAAGVLEMLMLTQFRPTPVQTRKSRQDLLNDLVKLNTLKAEAALRSGDADTAVAKLRATQKLAPAASSILENLHQLLVDAGRETEAEDLFATCYGVTAAAVERFPGCAHYHNNHAWLLARCGKNLDEAILHAERAIALSPTNGTFHNTLAEVHFQRGDRAKAVAESEKAVALLDGDAQVLHQLERFKNGKPTDR